MGSSESLSFFYSYDVIFTAGADEIINKFLKFEANVVFSAEDFCWPDKSLEVRIQISFIAKLESPNKLKIFLEFVLF